MADHISMTDLDQIRAETGRPDLQPEDLLTTKGAAKRTGLSENTLAQYRIEGPRFFKLYGTPVYLAEDLDEFMENRPVRGHREPIELPPVPATLEECEQVPVEAAGGSNPPAE